MKIYVQAVEDEEAEASAAPLNTAGETILSAIVMTTPTGYFGAFSVWKTRSPTRTQSRNMSGFI